MTFITPPSTMASASETFWQHTPIGAMRHLPQGDFRALVRFGVRAHAHLEAGQRLVQAIEIALESVQVQQQGGRVDFSKRLAGAGGRGKVGRHRLV